MIVHKYILLLNPCINGYYYNLFLINENNHVYLSNVSKLRLGLMMLQVKFAALGSVTVARDGRITWARHTTKLEG